MHTCYSKQVKNIHISFHKSRVQATNVPSSRCSRVIFFLNMLYFHSQTPSNPSICSIVTETGYLLFSSQGRVWVVVVDEFVNLKIFSGSNITKMHTTRVKFQVKLGSKIFCLGWIWTNCDNIY